MRFSERVPVELDENRISKLARSKRETGVRLLDLTTSNPTRVGLDYPRAEILEALADPRSLTYQPCALGLPTAREAVADYYRRRGKEVDPEDVVLTASTSEAYSLLFMLLCDCGQSVLAPRPGYPLIEQVARAVGAQTDFYRLEWEGEWTLAQDSLPPPGQIPCAAVMVHPNNPTGSYLKRREFQRFASILGQDCPILCDEVFADYRLEGDPAAAFDPLSGEDRPSFVLNGLSKAAGLPQLKLAWIVLRGPGFFRTRARGRLEVLCDTYLSVATPVQHSAGRLLRIAPRMRDAILARVRSNLKTLREGLTDTSATVLPVEGGWQAVIRVPAFQSDEEWAWEILAQRDVLVHAGYLFDFAGMQCLVVSLLPKQVVFEEGVLRLAEVFR